LLIAIQKKCGELLIKLLDILVVEQSAIIRSALGGQDGSIDDDWKILKFPSTVRGSIIIIAITTGGHVGIVFWLLLALRNILVPMKKDFLQWGSSLVLVDGCALFGVDLHDVDVGVLLFVLKEYGVWIVSDFFLNICIMKLLPPTIR
jgi:hypothetical protein